jgi:hypothetical protein
MTQAIVVTARPQMLEGGDNPLDLFSFVRNELDAENIEATIYRVDPTLIEQALDIEGMQLSAEPEGPDDKPCECANCAWSGYESGLGKSLFEIHHLASRLSPGEETPAGECPECGAFAYLVKEEKDE